MLEKAAHSEADGDGPDHSAAHHDDSDHTGG